MRRSVGTASRTPELVRQGSDIVVSERRDSVSTGGHLGVPMSLLGVFESLPRMLVSRQVILFALFLSKTMGMRGSIVQFCGPLVVFVMRSVVVTCRHKL